MMQRRIRLRDALVFAGSLLLPAALSAQMAAFRDLTLGWRVPSQHLSIPQSCNSPSYSISDGEEVPQAKDLELTIVAVSPAKLEIGGDFDATVRLKNTAQAPILVPSNPDGERVVRTSGDGTEEKYEVGDVSFRLSTGKGHGLPVYLDSAGALFADPDDKSSYLSLAPGRWLEMKLHARVECGLSNCMGEIHPDNQATLNAWWYQRVLNHQINGCKESNGTVKVRELDSVPFTVVVEEPSSKNSALALNQ
jgi:hypothetical protein